MAKGGRGGKRGTGGGGSVELTLPDGSKIEFEGNLTYDGNDKALSGAVRKRITDFEAKRAKAKIEYGFAVDAQGNPIGPEVRGGKGSVRVPYSYHNTQDSTFTHIHPRGDGMLGGTFSTADMRNFASYNNKTCRAKAKEGTYSISKTANFDKQGFKDHVARTHRRCQADYSARQRKLNQACASGQLGYDEYKKQSARSFNTMLVDLHNGYKSGQKQYGYTYTLERG